MEQLIIEYLKTIHKKTVTLLEIQTVLPGGSVYEDFAKAILELESKQVLLPVKSHKSDGRFSGLYNTYRIGLEHLNKEYIEQIQPLQLQVHSSISLQSYVKLSQKQWEKDLEYIKLIDCYIKQNGLPNTDATSPERSYELCKDEKWIDEKGGRTVLERLNLWDGFKINNNRDPLMLAVNPKAFKTKTYHLIVENKSIFYILLKILPDTNFTSLIYGCGWKIVAGIDGLYKQLGIEQNDSTLYYFGDLDYEGISIYNVIKDKALLATSFYTALLQQDKPSFGKHNQQKNQEALTAFLQKFSIEQSIKIEDMLKEGYYYPQEALTKEKALESWRQLNGF